MTKLYVSLKNRLQHDEEGATMVEYGLMVAGVAIVAAVGAGLLGDRLDAFFDTITFS